MKVEIDPGAGPCYGVERAIEIAEQVIHEKNHLLCVGDLIHNEQEMERLENLGLETVDLKVAISSHPPSILFRAHGEHPASYKAALAKGIKIIDATCPIVKKLQKQIEETCFRLKRNGGRIVIFGTKNHPEIISLMGFCEGNIIIIERLDEVDSLDLENPIYLFSQTTKYHSEYLLIKKRIQARLKAKGFQSSTHLIFHDSSCKIVAKRDKQLGEFIKNKDIIVFVSGKKSSNGKQLFQICLQSKIPSYFISKPEDLVPDWFRGKVNIGVSGATSTPYWLLELFKKRMESLKQ